MTGLDSDPAEWHDHIEALIHASPDFIAIAAMDGRVRFVNEKGRELVGMPSDVDVTKTSIADYLTAEGLRQSVEVEQPAVVRDGLWHGRTTLKDWRTGAPIAVEVTSFTLRNDAGEPIGLATIQRDIREYQARAAILAELANQRAHSERLESLGRLAGGVAHDFNNMLMVISNYVEMIDQRHSDDRTRRDISQVRAALTQATALTRQLLTFARADETTREVIPLDETVASVISLLSSSLDGRYTLNPDYTSGASVLASPNHLTQVVMNLVLNARDAMPAGGVIEVRTERARRDGREQAVIVVADQGVGMDPETAARAFEPFFTTKPRGKGTGLGLATVYGIVTELGGSVRFDSALGHGTKVTVNLPITADAGPVEPAPERVSARRGGRGRGRVLIVDGDAAVRGGIAGRLRDLGVEALGASNADEALSVLLNEATAVDLVLYDNSTAGVPGAEFDAMVRRYAEVPVILMSGLPTSESDGESIIAKPIEDEVLRALLERYVTHHGQ